LHRQFMAKQVRPRRVKLGEALEAPTSLFRQGPAGEFHRGQEL